MSGGFRSDKCAGPQTTAHLHGVPHEEGTACTTPQSSVRTVQIVSGFNACQKIAAVTDCNTATATVSPFVLLENRSWQWHRTEAGGESGLGLCDTLLCARHLPQRHMPRSEPHLVSCTDLLHVSQVVDE